MFSAAAGVGVAATVKVSLPKEYAKGTPATLNPSIAQSTQFLKLIVLPATTIAVFYETVAM
jgi:hypothetical protein